MTNTVKMPRQHNRRLQEIQSSFWINYLYILADYLVGFGIALLVVLCIWGATEAYDWLCVVTTENVRLKVGLNEEHAAFKATFNQDAEDRRQAQFEREQAIKDLCRHDERGCKIIKTE